MTAGDCTWLRNCRKLKWVVGVVTFYSIHHRNIHPTRLRVTSDYVSSVWSLAEWGKMGERPSQWGRNWKAKMILLLSDFEENSRSFHGSWSWKSRHFFAHVSHDAALSYARVHWQQLIENANGNSLIAPSQHELLMKLLMLLPVVSRHPKYLDEFVSLWQKKSWVRDECELIYSRTFVSVTWL